MDTVSVLELAAITVLGSIVNFAAKLTHGQQTSALARGRQFGVVPAEAAIAPRNASEPSLRNSPDSDSLIDQPTKLA